jgi:hypothetical protein
MWEQIPEGPRADGWIEIAETGWDAMISWFAGPDNIRREARGPRTEMVKVSCEKSDGAVIAWEEPITEDDVRAIEDDIDAYLRDAGLPPRPRGYRWFLRLPDGLDMAGVDDAASRVVMALPGRSGNPRYLAPAVEQAITDLYFRE